MLPRPYGERAKKPPSETYILCIQSHSIFNSNIQYKLFIALKQASVKHQMVRWWLGNIRGNIRGHIRGHIRGNIRGNISSY